VEFAKMKLLCGSFLNEWASLVREDATLVDDATKQLNKAAIAMLCARACVSVSPRSHVAAYLVANYMGVCLGISPDREGILVGFPSEPVLSEAAAALLNTGIGIRFALMQLKSAIEVGYSCLALARLLA
jgi:hypothetical protein